MASTVICPNCGTSTDGQDSLCPVCSAALYDGAEGYDPQPGAEDDVGDVSALGQMPSVYDQAAGTVSSGGRRPGASPAERAAFLADADRWRDRAERFGDLGLPLAPSQDGTPPLFTQIARAERAVEMCEADLDEARAQYAYARERTRNEALDDRALDPELRHQWITYRAAEDRFAQCQRAADNASRRLSMLLAEYDQLTVPPGRYPHPWDSDGP